jgi:hypothetical protein
MTSNTVINRRRRSRLHLVAAVRAGMLVAFMASIGACDVTHVAEPDEQQLVAFQNAQGAALLRAGAIAEFSTALSQQMLFSGLLVDEFTDAPLTDGASQEDRRVIIPTSTDYPFAQLSRSRIDALNAIDALKRYAPTPAWHVGELYSLVAVAELAFGENVCSGVPLAVVSGGHASYGPSLSRDSLLARAMTDLDSASAYVTGSDSIGSLVAVLRGRVLLDEGQQAAAGVAISGVPLTFAYPLVFSPAASSQLSELYEQIGLAQAYSVSDREGINGLPYVSGADPRVVTTPVDGANGPIYEPDSVSSPTASIVLANGIEAQLIAAEAALAAGQTSSWANILNTLRASAIAPAMVALPADSTTGASAPLQLAVMFRERAFWLFATGHRHGDLRRLVRQYGEPVESVFPTGLYQGGPSSYGTAVVFTPAGEEYDPSYRGCIDTSA